VAQADIYFLIEDQSKRVLDKIYAPISQFQNSNPAGSSHNSKSF